MSSTLTRYLTYTFPSREGTEVTEVNSGQANTPLLLNGSLRDRSGADQISFIQDGYSRSVAFDSETKDLSGMTFTLQGMQKGVFVTEDVTGPPANNIVYSQNCYDTVTSIVPTQTFNDVLKIGSGSQGWILIETDPFQTSATNLQVKAFRKENTLKNAILSSIIHVQPSGMSVNEMIATNLAGGDFNTYPNSFFTIDSLVQQGMVSFSYPPGGRSILVVFGFQQGKEVPDLEDGYTVVFSQS